jgi:hypothetical protein
MPVERTTTWILAATLVACAGAMAQDLELEEGPFATVGLPSEQDLVLAKALLEGDRHRECQLVIIPSWVSPSAVYIVPGETGDVTVVSRTRYRESVVLTRRGKWRINAEPFVVRRTAELDRPTAARLGTMCRDVLLRARRPDMYTAGLDGTSYHAGHQVLRGPFLTGKTWSPQADTIAGTFVAMELALKAYAESPPEERTAARLDLLAKAEALGARLKGAATGTSTTSPHTQPVGEASSSER